MHMNLAFLFLVFGLNFRYGCCQPTEVPKYTYIKYNFFGVDRCSYDIHQVSEFYPDEIDNVAMYTETVYKQGWYVQKVKVTNALPAIDTAYLMGFMETFAIIDQVKAHWKNTWGTLCGNADSSVDCQKLKQTLQGQVDHMINKSLSFEDDNSYQLLLLLWQMKGASDAFYGRSIGYSIDINVDALKSLRDDVFGTYLISVSNDIPQIVNKLNLKSLLAKAQRLQITANAVVRISSKLFYDVLFAHITRTDYRQMLRVVKSYSIPFVYQFGYKRGQRIPGYRMDFSSYPGAIGSLDEFYSAKSLVILKSENEGMYAKVSPPPFEKRKSPRQDAFNFNETLPTSLQCLLATRLSNNIYDWAFEFTKNQPYLDSSTWLVFDRSKFRESPGYILQGAFLVMEITADSTYFTDASKLLQINEMWIQFGVPYFKQVYENLGYADMKTAFGRYFSYGSSPIGSIMRRDIAKTNSLSELVDILRVNNYTADAFSKCACLPPYSASLSASPRGDLNKIRGKYKHLPWLDYRLAGGIDIKVTQLSEPDIIRVQSGPTTNGGLPPFVWTEHGKMPLEQHPNQFNFDLLKIKTVF